MTIAQYDHINYGEYLPILMGDELVQKHSLNPGATGPGAGFIKEVNPGVLANFASSSYRNPAVSYILGAFIDMHRHVHMYSDAHVQ